MDTRSCLLTIMLGLVLGFAGLPKAHAGTPACPGCAASEQRPPVRSGMWFDPDREGSSMTLDVQGDTLAGIYFGFEEDGASIWYLFAAPLEKVQRPAGDWQASGELARYSGGNSLHGESRKPAVDGVEGTIRLTFVHRNLLHYQVGDGPVHRMQPLVFGTSMITRFPGNDAWLPELPDVTTSDVGDPWLITIRRDDDPDHPVREVGPYWAVSSFDAATGYYSIQFHERTGASPPMYPYVFIGCGKVAEWPDFHRREPPPAAFAEEAGDTPLCLLELMRFGQTFHVAPLRDVGDDYFIFTSLDGKSVIEGRRILYR